MHDIPVDLEEKAVNAAAGAILAFRGHGFAGTPEDGIHEYELTHRTIEETRLGVAAYLAATSPIPSGKGDLIDGLYSLAFDGRLGDWKTDPDARLVLEAIQSLRTSSAREEARRRKPLPINEVAALVDDKLRLLDGLYERTGRDWTLTVSNVLTEPVCPTALIAQEGSNSLRFSIHRDSIVEAIVDAIDLAHRELVLGESIAPETPISNPDDRRRACYLKVVEGTA